MNDDILNEESIDAAIADLMSGATLNQAVAGRRQLQETTGRLAAASPHLTPPAELRGRILQATAPTTFRMEDYRKAVKDSGRFYRWGFAAAMVFLMAGSYYNMSMQSKVQAQQSQVAQITSQANDIIASRDAMLKERNALLSEVLSPASQQVFLKRGDGQTAAEAFINVSAHRAILVVPQGAIPKGGKLMLNAPGGEQFATNLIEAPSGFFGEAASGQLSPNITIQNAKPSTQHPPVMDATMGN